MPLPVGLIAYNKLVDYAAQRSIYVDDPTANALLVGNGPSALQTIAPGTNGQVLTSNGTAWEADDPAATAWATPGTIGSTTPNSIVGTTGRFNNDLTLAGAPGKIKPAADSTTALQMANAAGTAFATWDTTNSRLGLGITPTERLHIFGTSSVRFKAGNSTKSWYWSIGLPAADTFSFGDDSAYRLIIKATNTGLGITDPEAKLSIAEQASGNAGFKTWSNAQRALLDVYFNSSDNFRRVLDISVTGDSNASFAGATMRFLTAGTSGATAIERARFDHTGAFIFNDGGLDSDMRFEGDTDANLFVLDAGLDVVSIGEAGVSGAKLNVNGTLRADGLRLDLTPTLESLTPTHSITISVNGTNYKIPLQAA